jgi:hypothetical protein
MLLHGRLVRIYLYSFWRGATPLDVFILRLYYGLAFANWLYALSKVEPGVFLFISLSKNNTIRWRSKELSPWTAVLASAVQG